VNFSEHVKSTIRGLSGDGRGWVLVVVSLGWFATLSVLYTLPSLVPFIKDAFALDNATVGLAITIMWVFYGVFQFPAGYLTDRIGERRTMVTSLLIGAISLVALAITPVFALLVISCALFGTGAGLFATPRVTSLQAAYPENDGTALGVVLAVGSVAGIVAPLAAVRFAANVDWRLAFLFGVPLFLFAAFGVWRVVPRQTRQTAATDREPGALLSSLATMFRKPAVFWAALAATCTFFVFQGLLAFLTTYLISVKGLAPGTTATYYSYFFAAAAVAQPIAGNVADFVGYKRVLVALSVVYAVVLAAMPLATGGIVVGLLVVLMGFQRGTTPVMNAYLVAVLPDEVRGTGYGLLRTMFMGVAYVGPFVAGTLADYSSFDDMFLFLAAVAGVGTVCYALLPPQR
jgi:MFS family permease